MHNVIRPWEVNKEAAPLLEAGGLPFTSPHHRGPSTSNKNKATNNNKNEKKNNNNKT